MPQASIRSFSVGEDKNDFFIKIITIQPVLTFKES